MFEGSSDLVTFSSSNHSKETLHNLNELRQNECFCDVQISVGTKTFKAHRVLLSACSPYFQAMFTSGLAESKKATIVLHSIQEDAFSTILDFIYTGSANITKDTVQDLLAAADMLHLPELVEACSDFLRRQLHPSNCIGIYCFADAHDCINLKTAAEKFICHHFVEVVDELEWLELPMETAKIFLQSEKLHIDNETQIFNAVMRWIFYELQRRRRYVFQLLSAVRLPLISNSYLEIYARNCEDLSLRIALTKLLETHFREMRLLSVDMKLGKNSDIRTQPRVCARKNIVVIGGSNRDPGRKWSESRTLDSVEKFDTFKHQWKTLRPMSVSRKSHGTALLNGIIYVVGGENDDSLIFSEGETYDYADDKWMLIPCMTKPRTDVCLCSVNGQIYALGGSIGSSLTESIECFFPNSQLWMECGKMTSPRCAMGAVVYQGLIYVVGGLSDLNTELDIVESYNPVIKEWNLITKLKHARAHVGIAILHNCLYAIGGSYEDNVESCVERYSFDQDTWEELPPLRWPRAAASVAVVNGLIYVIGGHTSGDEFCAPSTLDIVEYYDPESNSWYESTPIPTSRCGAGTVVL